MSNQERTITLTMPLQVFRGLTWLAESGQYDDYEANMTEEYGDGFYPGWKQEWETCSSWMQQHLDGLSDELDPAYEIYRVRDGICWGIFRASAQADPNDCWTLTAARAHCLAEAGVPAVEYLDTVYSGDPEAEDGSEPKDLAALEEEIAYLKRRVSFLEEREQAAR